MHRVLLAFLVLSAFAVSQTSIASAGTVGKFVRVDEGEVGGVLWSVRMARQHGERCYDLFTLRGAWGGEGTVCGDSGPPSDWSHVLGDAGADGEPSIELNLTSPRIRTLNLLLGHPVSHRPPTWKEFPTHVLNAKQARISHMPRDFRFAVVTEVESACIEAVEGRDRWGHVVLSEEVPCEF
jgi:hypothetical protein